MKKMFTREYSNYLYQSRDKEVYLLRPTKKQWDNIKQFTIQIIRISEEEERKEVNNNLFE